MPIQPILSPALTSPVLRNTSAQDSPDRIRQAANEFEGFLIAQMLKSARESSGGGLTGDADDTDDANSSVMEMGEQQFAQALSANGGLGIAKMVVAGLTKHADR